MSQTGYPTGKEKPRFFYWLLDYPVGGKIKRRCNDWNSAAKNITEHTFNLNNFHFKDLPDRKRERVFGRLQ